METALVAARDLDILGRQTDMSAARRAHRNLEAVRASVFGLVGLSRAAIQRIVKPCGCVEPRDFVKDFAAGAWPVRRQRRVLRRHSHGKKQRTARALLRKTEASGLAFLLRIAEIPSAGYPRTVSEVKMLTVVSEGRSVADAMAGYGECEPVAPRMMTATVVESAMPHREPPPAAHDFTSSPRASAPMPAYVPLPRGIGETYADREWYSRPGSGSIHRDRLFQEVQAGRERLRATIVNLGPAVAMSVLLSMLEAQSPETYDHAERVSRLSVAIARAIGLSPAEIRDIRHAGLLHDIGKLAVPNAVLSRIGPLTEEEIAVLRLHVTIGAEILADVPSLSTVAPLVAGSHERFDGRGYPDGLTASAIPLGARIIAVADSYDAMTARRPYGDPMSPEDANTELRRCAGSYFDPEVVNVWLEMVQNPRYV